MVKKQNLQKGQGLIEFVLILTLVAATSMLSLNLMGISVQDAYASVVEAFTGDDPCQNYYQNSFDEELDGWSRLQTPGFWRGNFKTKDGQLVGNSLGALMLDAYNGSNYAINVHNPSLVNTKKTYNGYGVIFRGEYDKYDRLDGYMFEIERVDYKQAGQMYFSKWVNGYQIQPPLAAVDVPKDFDWNNPGNLTIVAQDNTFQAFLDGEKVLEMQDDTYKDGQVGLAVNDGSRLYLDDFGIDSPACKE